MFLETAPRVGDKVWAVHRTKKAVERPGHTRDYEKEVRSAARIRVATVWYKVTAEAVEWWVADKDGAIYEPGDLSEQKEDVEVAVQAWEVAHG